MVGVELKLRLTTTFVGICKLRSQCNTILHSLYWQKLRRLIIPSVGENVEQQELLDTACGSLSEYPTLENTLLVNLSIHTHTSSSTLCSTGIRCFSKAHFMPLRFHERATLVPVFMNWKKAKDDFHFYKNRWKVKMVFSVWSGVSRYRGSKHPEGEWHR